VNNKDTNFTLSTDFSQFYSQMLNRMKNLYNFKEIRELRGLNQAEFAQALGVSREYVNKIEKGRCDVTKGIAARLQQFIQEQYQNEVPEIDILGGAHPAPPAASVPYYEQRREKKQEKTILEVPLVAQKAQAGYVRATNRWTTWIRSKNTHFHRA
jgi:transcriptional regulator with XRE-family HTH domain